MVVYILALSAFGPEGFELRLRDEGLGLMV